MTIKTRKNSASVGSFVDGVDSEKRRKDCRTVMKLMKEVTGKPPVMWGTSIICYGAYRYTNTTRIENEWPLTGLSPRKNELTVYIMPGFSKYRAIMDKIGKHRTGKSCLYIRDLDDIHMPSLRKLIERSVADMKRMYKTG